MTSSSLLTTGRLLLAPIGWLFERLGNRFYVGLAVLLAILFAWAIVFGHMRGMQNQAYDLIMKNRFHVQPPNPDIVLVDIDEASLAAMAAEYGRWPWPRSVMAEFIETVSALQPQAVVFDITFVDADINYPDADIYLAEVAARFPNTFFTMVRLNAENDAHSELRLSELAGVNQMAASASEEDTVAMIVPYFYSVLKADRLGTNNIYPGSDGVARRYDLYRDLVGYRIGSLPANVLKSIGRPLPVTQDMLINWRGGPGVYPTYSFHSLFQQLTGHDTSKVQAGLQNKIVIVGSTAPSLFDFKPSPLSPNHPGVEILATVIDNLYTGDNLRQLPQWIYAIATSFLLALLATAFVYNMDYRLLNPVFTVVQAGFLTISFLFLNYSTVFVDLSAPFAAGLIYFFIARLYSLGLNLRRNGHPLFSSALDTGNCCQVLLMRCALPQDQSEARRVRTLLLRRVGLTTYGVSAPRIFKQSPLLAALYRDNLLVYWLVPSTKKNMALRDMIRMLDSTIQSLAARSYHVEFLLDAFELDVDQHGDWRATGRTAMAHILASGDLSNEKVTHIETTPAFASVCDEVEVSARLRDAGLGTN